MAPRSVSHALFCILFAIQALPAFATDPCVLVLQNPGELPARRFSIPNRDPSAHDFSLTSKAYLDWKSAMSGSPDKVAVAEDATRAFFKSRGIRFVEENLKEGGGLAFRFVAESAPSAHSMNRLADELTRDLPGVKLIYSPSALLRRLNGFFSERDFALGISNQMFESATPDPTFFHEVIHASHAVARESGTLDSLNTVVRLRERKPGWQISKVRSGYFTLQTFEEVEAYIENIAILSRQLFPFYGRTLNPKELTQAGEVLDQIHHASTVANEVVRQTQEIAQRALAALHSPKLSAWEQVEGRTDLWKRRLILNAYEPKASRQWTEHTDGAEIMWRLGSTDGGPPQFGITDFENGFKATIEITTPMKDALKRVENSITWMIERSQPERTNLQSVMFAAEELDRLFNGWKKKNSRITIPTLFDGK